MNVIIGVSNRHVHLKEEHLKELFGENFKLEKFRDLRQPGQYASNSFVTIKTDKDKIEKVRIIGPCREYTQVEISKTDSYKLGINPPIRNSGDLKESVGVTLIGPNGTLDLEDGCIIPTRHIHLSEEHIKAYGLQGREKVSVVLRGEKGGIINNVYLKITKDSVLELHLDTDDANAHLIKNGDIGDIL